MFPKDSAFKQAMDAGAGQPPLRTPEDNQRIADERRADPTCVFIPVSDLERWAFEIEDVAGMQKSANDQADLENVANEIRSYFKG